VAFESDATNLVAGDTNATTDVFVRDRLNFTTKRVSVNNSGIQGNSRSFDPSIDAGGSIVAFESAATNLVAGDTNAFIDVFVHREANVQPRRVQPSGRVWIAPASRGTRSALTRP
jgi:hypothetical protein